MAQAYPLVMVKLRRDPQEINGARTCVIDLRLRFGNIHTVNMFVRLFGNFLKQIFHNKRYRIVGVVDFSDQGGDLLYCGEGEHAGGTARFRAYKRFGKGSPKNMLVKEVTGT